MCGIFAVYGQKDVSKIIIKGLKRLEYRGYDSWGIAMITNAKKAKIIKKVGAIGDLQKLPFTFTGAKGLGHTRWATHGGVTKTNAHPHEASDKSFVLAHNGIVENCQELKKMLIKKGHHFITQTDTEVIVRLIEEKLLRKKNLTEAVRLAFLALAGRNTIIVLSTISDEIVAVRCGSPLLVGIGKNEYFFSSDYLSFAERTNKVFILDDYQIASLKNGQLVFTNAKTNKRILLKVKKFSQRREIPDKQGHDYFMIKEILEQKQSIWFAADCRQKELKSLALTIKKANQVYVIGAGSASFAAGQIAFMLRKIAGVNARGLLAYEFLSFKNLFKPGDLMIAVSQSGETADTLEAIEIAKKKGVKIASIVNVMTSSMSRISDLPFFCHSGPEVCVATTKVFTAQLAWGLLLAKTTAGKYTQGKNIIKEVKCKLADYFSPSLEKKIDSLSGKMVKQEHGFILGRGANYYIALEAALKLKEITYKHFEGFSAGELKHGVIALVRKGTPVFVIMSQDEMPGDILSAAVETKSRGAWLIGVGHKYNPIYNDFIQVPQVKEADFLINIIPFQLLAYFLALKLGYNPDKPRNLAKSVTVK